MIDRLKLETWSCLDGLIDSRGEKLAEKGKDNRERDNLSNSERHWNREITETGKRRGPRARTQGRKNSGREDL